MIYKTTLTWYSILPDDGRKYSRTYRIDDSTQDVLDLDILLNGSNMDHVYIYIDFWEARGYNFTVTVEAEDVP